MANLELELNEKLKTLLKQTALCITEQQQNQLVKLVLLLHKWNKTYNLTSVRDPMENVSKTCYGQYSSKSLFTRT